MELKKRNTNEIVNSRNTSAKHTVKIEIKISKSEKQKAEDNNSKINGIPRVTTPHNDTSSLQQSHLNTCL